MSEIIPANISTDEPEDIEVIQDQAYPNAKTTAALFFIYILSLIIVAIVGNVISMNIPRDEPVVRSILRLLLYAAPLLMVISYALKRVKKQQEIVPIINYNKIQGWLIPVLILSAPAFSIMIERTSAWIPMPNFVREIFERTFTKNIFSILTATIAAPIIEEILCRGIILKGLLKNYSPTKAIIISALFFSLMHLNPWQSIPAFFGGLFLGWIYYKTQSAIAGIIFHAAINTTGFVFLFVGNAKQQLPDLFGKMYYPALFISVLTFAAICVLINKKALAIPRSQPISTH